MTILNRGQCPIVETLNDIAMSASGALARHPALEDEAGHLSYHDLWQAVLTVAEQLPDRKDPAQTRTETGSQTGAQQTRPMAIAVYGALDRTFLICLLAIWSKGHITVPIDESAPLARRKLMMQADWIDLVIDATYAMPADLASDHQAVWQVKVDPQAPDVLAGDTFCDRPDAAYVTFSSGTTGRPKAILGRASSLDYFIRWQAGRFDFASTDRVPVITSPSFDPYMREILTPLSRGATLIMVPPELRTRPDSLVDFLSRKEITRLHAVPTLAAHWVRAAQEAGLGFEPLQTIFSAGEPLPSELVQDWRQLAPNAQMVNLYGPSETTLAKFYSVVPQLVPDSRNLPVGQPMPDTKAVIVGDDGLQKAEGEVGHVYIDTAYASYGTVDDGWGAATARTDYACLGPHLYPTGDYGCLGPKGLQILGRSDNQIKISGVRFDPVEVTDALRALPMIEDAFAFAVERGDGHGKSVQAIYVPISGQDASMAQSMELLKKALVPAMIPSRLLAVAALPVTPNGKIDRAAAKALIEQDMQQSRPDGEQDDSLLEPVLALFQSSFPKAEVTAQDTFFALGGDSILATMLAGKLAEQLGKQCAIADIFAYPSPAELADHLAKAADRHVTRLSFTRPQSERDDAQHYGYSERQKAYHAVCMMEGDRDWCILSRVLTGLGEISEARIRQAYLKLAERHDVLRCSFPSEGAEPVQNFAPVAALDASRLEISHVTLAKGDEASQISALRAQGSKRLFDLSRAPLIRFALVQGEREQSLILWAHHLILDGPSLNALVEELVTLVCSPPRSGPVKSAPPTNEDRKKDDSPSNSPSVLGYRDFITWQKEQKQRKQDTAYWRSLLADYQPVTVNERLVYEEGKSRDPMGALYTRPFDPALVAAVHAKAKMWQCTPFVLLLAGYMRAIAQRAKHASPAVIVPMQAKGPSQFNETLGLFFTMALVRMQAQEIGPDGRFAQELKHQLLAAGDHCDYEFHHRIADQARLHSQTDAATGKSAVADPFYFPLTTALFNQNRLPEGMDYDAATPMGLHSLGRSLRFQIQGEVQVKGEDFLISYLHRETVFADEGGIEAFADCVEAQISDLVL